MTRHINPIVASLMLGVLLASGAAAQQRPSIAIMPTQYFSAQPESAEMVTRGLVQRFEQDRYNVMPMERSRAVFDELGYSLTTDIGDPQILQFGRRIGADLVAHPQLLAVGRPLGQAALTDTKAVLYLRVVNVRTGNGLYTRQIAYEFPTEPVATTAVPLPEPVALAAANEVSRFYFERVAGSRQEIGRPAR